MNTTTRKAAGLASLTSGDLSQIGTMTPGETKAFVARKNREAREKRTADDKAHQEKMASLRTTTARWQSGSRPVPGARRPANRNKALSVADIYAARNAMNHLRAVRAASSDEDFERTVREFLEKGHVTSQEAEELLGHPLAPSDRTAAPAANPAPSFAELAASIYGAQTAAGGELIQSSPRGGATR